MNSRIIVLMGYWRTVQCIMMWLQQQKAGCTSWAKTFRLQSQIRVTIFASFWQEKALEAKPDSVTIFPDSRLADATLWASRYFKQRKFS